jgi:hypothetical protein
LKKLLSAALKGEPWSVGALVFGLDDVLDEEGRPLHERRAPSATKTGVPMVLEACPYQDERRGLPMNVSALEQLLRFFPATAARVAAFRGMIGPRARPWEQLLLGLLDLLAAPALHLLQRRDPEARVPGLEAAGYKLAAGYFDALRRLLALEARGSARPCTADGFLSFIRAERVLLGPSEVCAGRWEHISALSRLLLDSSPPVVPAVPRRVEVARLLAAQVRLGISWKLVDELAEWRLLVARGALRPRNHVVAERLRDRLLDLRAAQPALEHARRALPDEAGPLCEALTAWEDGKAASEEAVRAVGKVLAAEEGGFELLGPREASQRELAGLLELRAAFLATQHRLERELRTALGFPHEPGIELGAAVLPRSACLDWLQAISGHEASFSAQGIVLKNHRRTVLVAGPQ